jgi:hypothetical protein
LIINYFRIEWEIFKKLRQRRLQVRKVIHRSKNIFCGVLQNCNLVPEFNGLVSKGVNLKIGPFIMIIPLLFNTYLSPIATLQKAIQF